MARGSVLADLSASTVISRVMHYVNAAYTHARLAIAGKLLHAHEFVLQDVHFCGSTACQYLKTVYMAVISRYMVA